MPIPADNSPLNSFYEISEKIKAKYKDIKKKQRMILFDKWKQLSSNIHHFQTVGHRQYNAANCESSSRPTFTTVSELFNFLFPTENNGNTPEVKSSAVPDDEFDQMPNFSNIDDLFENEFFDDTEWME